MRNQRRLPTKVSTPKSQKFGVKNRQLQRLTSK